MKLYLKAIIICILSSHLACENNESVTNLPSEVTVQAESIDLNEPSVKLIGTSLQEGLTGRWTIESMNITEGTFSISSEPNTVFKGDYFEEYTIRWTISNGVNSVFDELMLRISDGANINDLINANVSIEQLLSAGYSVNELFEAGIQVGDLKKYGVSETDLMAAGLVGKVVDCEGNSYPWVKIGDQIWMSENLATTKFSDCTEIPNIIDNLEWWAFTNSAYCWYNNDSASFSDPYGALYNFYSVNDDRNICPVGWHVPSIDEFEKLTSYLGGSEKAGGELKEEGFSTWNDPNFRANNSSAFTAMPGGERYWDLFINIGYYGYYWTSTQKSDEFAYVMTLSYGESSALINAHALQAGQSVRCVKD